LIFEVDLEVDLGGWIENGAVHAALTILDANGDAPRANGSVNSVRANREMSPMATAD
jgi:hypothetical protein